MRSTINIDYFIFLLYFRLNPTHFGSAKRIFSHKPSLFLTVCLSTPHVFVFFLLIIFINFFFDRPLVSFDSYFTHLVIYFLYFFSKHCQTILISDFFVTPFKFLHIYIILFNLVIPLNSHVLDFYFLFCIDY